MPIPTRYSLVAALVVWSGAIGGRWLGLQISIVIVVGCLVVGHRFARSVSSVALLAGLAVVGVWSGVTSVDRENSVLGFGSGQGPVKATLRLSDDPKEGRYGWWALARFDPPRPFRPPAIPVLAAFDEARDFGAGDLLTVRGIMRSQTGTARGRPYSGVLKVDQVLTHESSSTPWMVAGNAVRARALESLRDSGRGRGLLAGFLVGETSGVSEADMTAMRRSGLSHLVAVSGSNVALFLGLVLLALGPLSAGPRRRAVLGLVALVVFVVATRWEPSVVRAAVMAALILSGRIGGWALDGLVALAATVVVAIAVAGQLSVDVGFVLSVLATFGVLVATRYRVEWLPRVVSTALMATLGAQAAVTPVLLAVFGSVPLLSPLTNLLAAPVVAVTTGVGAVGVGLRSEPLIAVASVGAEVVLVIAEMASGWPQLGWTGTALVVGFVVAMALPVLRPVAVVTASGVLIFVLVGAPRHLPAPGAVVFDVGQGDAILVVGSGRSTVLVDGGPDPGLLEAKLADYGVTDLDLVVLSHVHADHAQGLSAVIGRRPVGEFWFPSEPHRTSASEAIRRLADEAGVPMFSPSAGSEVDVGDIHIEVLGPVRRYASPNDQSYVLEVQIGGGPRLLLTGDIETYAQADLRGLTTDVLKVPHQGGATSDVSWLGATGAELAVISVGPNEYGHPSVEVIDALTEAGMDVIRTDVSGDVAVPLG